MKRWTPLLAVLPAACGDTEPANEPPEVAIRIQDLEIPRNAVLTYNLQNIFTDPDGDPLTYRAGSSDPDLVFVWAENWEESAFVVARAGPGMGTVTVRVWAHDPADDFAVQDFKLTVANRLPERIEEIPDMELVGGNVDTVMVASYFHDRDGDPLTYSATSSEASVAVVSIDDAVLEVTAVDSGVAVVIVTAHDGHGGEATDTFDVEVRRGIRYPRRAVPRRVPGPATVDPAPTPSPASSATPRWPATRSRTRPGTSPRPGSSD